MRNIDALDCIVEAAAEAGYTLTIDEAEKLWKRYESRKGCAQDLPVDFMELLDIIESEMLV